MGTKNVGSLSSRLKRDKNILPYFTRLTIAGMRVLLYKNANEDKKSYTEKRLKGII